METDKLKIMNSAKIKIGISSCLLGKKVRFDAGHKHDKYITEILGLFVKFIPVCPEIEVGMGVPREAVRLIGDIEQPKMIGTKTATDWTSQMNTYAKNRVKKKNLDDLSGFVLKGKSPSCGMERVKVYGNKGPGVKKGIGLFAAALIKQFPDLPVEEEGRLNDAAIRENFIERIFAYNRLQELYNKPFDRKQMIEFHTNHKFLLLAHNPEYYRKLGQLVAKIKDYSVIEFRGNYQTLFMQTLKFKTTVKKNTNVLQHIAGFLKKKMSAVEKEHLREAIQDYHQSLVPLITPITLLKHFIHKYEVEYIQNQYYLNPHPKELMLRNHV